MTTIMPLLDWSTGSVNAPFYLSNPPPHPPPPKNLNKGCLFLNRNAINPEIRLTVTKEHVPVLSPGLAMANACNILRGDFSIGVFNE